MRALRFLGPPPQAGAEPATATASQGGGESGGRRAFPWRRGRPTLPMADSVAIRAKRGQPGTVTLLNGGTRGAAQVSPLGRSGAGGRKGNKGEPRRAIFSDPPEGSYSLTRRQLRTSDYFLFDPVPNPNGHDSERGAAHCVFVTTFFCVVVLVFLPPPDEWRIMACQA